MELCPLSNNHRSGQEASSKWKVVFHWPFCRAFFRLGSLTQRREPFESFTQVLLWANLGKHRMLTPGNIGQRGGLPCCVLPQHETFEPTCSSLRDQCPPHPKLSCLQRANFPRWARFIKGSLEEMAVVLALSEGYIAAA